MKLRIMSHNLWKNDKNRWESLGLDCSARHRAPGLAKVYLETQPDLIGIQEASPLMVSLIVAECGREGLRYELIEGGDTPILYRPDRLKPVEIDFLRYPEELPGHDGSFNNNGTKSYTLVRFETAEGGELAFASTHLWWKSDDLNDMNYQAGSGEARDYQMRLLLERLDREKGCPTVFCGDLNTGYNTPPVKRALAAGFGHGHDLATEYADEGNGHHHCGRDGFSPYVPKPFETGIDHMFFRGLPEGAVRRFDRYVTEEYLPLSDHLPVYADVEI